MDENTISKIMKESVAGTSLKKSEKKKLRIIVQGKQQSASWTTRGIDFLNDYDKANEEERWRLSLAISKWNYETPSAEKKQNDIFNNIGSFRHLNNCGSTTGQSMAASKENKLPPSFSGFKSQKFIHKSSPDGLSRTDNDEQSLKNSASIFYLWLLEAFPWFQNGSIHHVNAELS